MNIIRNFIAKLLERHSGNALRYRVIYMAGAIIHTIFIVLFANIQLDILVGFNIVSVLMYAAGSLFIRENRWSSLWIVLFYMEIVVHAVLCGILLDWSYGFSLYSLMVIPVSYYMAYMDPNIKNSTLFSTILTVINIVLMTVTGFLATGDELISNQSLAHAISVFNFAVCSIIIAIFASIYIYEMNNSMNDLKKKNDELNFLANYDALTNLRNRHHIADVFEIYEKNTKPFCVILGDIDDFKRINDTYSHDCGDKVLVTVADVISKSVGEQGTVCRWGGEEILIILSGESNKCLDMIEEIRLKIQNQHLSFNRREINITMTFGFADYSEDMRIEKLVSIADKRLYHGKKNGKNQVVYHQHNQ